MKSKIWIYLLTMHVVFLILFTTCKKKDNDENPPPVTTVTDIDGNVYNTITIGSQVWLAENLKVTKFNDGSAIQYIFDSTQSTLHVEYAWYNNDIANKAKYGALYNWETVSTGKLAPTGWHVPSDAEWTTLMNYLGGVNIAGGKLKEAGTNYWNNPNMGATNETEFTALPGGFRDNFGIFSDKGNYGFWLSSTEIYPNSNYVYGYIMVYDTCKVFREDYFEKHQLYSVRCIKD